MPTLSPERNARVEAHKVVRNDDCERCHYCGLTFGAFYHEHDHAPVPKNAGGEIKVPACHTCHELKDRAQMRNWPATESVTAVSGLLRRGILQQPGNTPDFSGEWPSDWDDMSRWERLMWARCAYLVHTEQLLLTAAS